MEKAGALLVQHAARHGVVLSYADAERLLRKQDVLPALRAVQDVCKVIRLCRSEQLELDFGSALRHLRACGGDPDETAKRLLWGAPGARPGVAEASRHAVRRGIDLEPAAIDRLVRTRGLDGAMRWIDKLHAVMAAADDLGVECDLKNASWRLSRAKGSVEAVVADLAAIQQRRVDGLTAPCGVMVPPRDWQERANAYAGCRCRPCREKLVIQMQPYIGKMLTNPFFADLDDARSEANYELTNAIDQWPGGTNFAGWFAGFFRHRVLHTYANREPEDRTMLSLDAPAIHADDRGGRVVSLLDRLADRSVDPAPVVERKLTIEASMTEKRRDREKRVTDYERRRGRAA
jgi:DNA-directed RNA polymerase specialized sigma24 family protein